MHSRDRQESPWTCDAWGTAGLLDRVAATRSRRRVVASWSATRSLQSSSASRASAPFRHHGTRALLRRPHHRPPHRAQRRRSVPRLRLPLLQAPLRAHRRGRRARRGEGARGQGAVRVPAPGAAVASPVDARARGRDRGGQAAPGRVRGVFEAALRAPDRLFRPERIRQEPAAGLHRPCGSGGPNRRRPRGGAQAAGSKAERGVPEHRKRGHGRAEDPHPHRAAERDPRLPDGALQRAGGQRGVVGVDAGPVARVPRRQALNQRHEAVPPFLGARCRPSSRVPCSQHGGSTPAASGHSSIASPSPAAPTTIPVSAKTRNSALPCASPRVRTVASSPPGSIRTLSTATWNFCRISRPVGGLWGRWWARMKRAATDDSGVREERRAGWIW